MKRALLLLMQKELSHTKKGFSIVEALLASSIFAILVLAMVGAYLYGEESTALSGNRARAIYIAEEGLEAVKNIRDAGFANLTDGTYGLSTTGNQWSLSGSSDTQGLYTRSVTIATVDAKRKLVTSHVSWQQNAQRTGSVSLVSRLSNWIASGLGTWAGVNYLSSLDLSGTDNSVKVTYQGDYAYVLRDPPSSNLVIINISDSSNPTIVSSLTLPLTPLDIVVSGNYAYISSSDNVSELEIVDISNPASPQYVASADAPGGANAFSISKDGPYVYISRAATTLKDFIVYDVSNPLLPIQVGSLDTPTGYDTAVSGSYLYMTTDSDTAELYQINISSASLPVVTSTLNLPGTSDALAVGVVGSYAYVGQDTSFHSVNIASTPTLVGTITLGGTVADISKQFGFLDTVAFVGTKISVKELSIVDVANPLSMSVLALGDVPNGTQLLGVCYDPVHDKVYGAGASNTNEFSIFSSQ